MPRLAVLKAMEEAVAPIGIADIQRALLRFGSGVAQPSIYTTLKQFEGAKLIRQVHPYGGKPLYALYVMADREAIAQSALVCSQCGEQRRIADERIDLLAKALCAEYGHELEGHQFAVQGRCPRCASRSGTERDTR